MCYQASAYLNKKYLRMLEIAPNKKRKCQNAKINCNGSAMDKA